MDGILDVVRRTFGHDSLLPLQGEAIRAGVDGRDSLVVLPTGGGKSLCYQVPPLVAGRTDVVVSPLIALMKDQVDGLVENGYPAAALHSHLTPGEQRGVLGDLVEGRLRLLFVSPERLLRPDFRDALRRAGVSAFAIDEAHCISHWGHDFRPEYRMLRVIREEFPETAFHAFTATATPRVREDIVDQLGLRDPEVLVGRFDRPNLIYRIVPKLDARRQVLEALRRHAGEAAIVYRTSRKDTETTASFLAGRGVRAAAYHAGMDKGQRTGVQDAFSREEIDVVVATVAFGMGIDRTDIRCVIHADMPQSVEHYQQETGRAGRDGLSAECVLFYSYADVIRWETVLARPSGDGEADPEAAAARLELLRHMNDLCGALRCRHLLLSRYFGQELPTEDCGACDVCLDEVRAMADSTTVAQKILSGVARTGQRYGVTYLVEVLRGADTENTRKRGHADLPTFGVLKEHSEAEVRNLVYQLVHQGLLLRTEGDRPILRLNRESVAVLKGDLEVRLREPAIKEKAAPKELPVTGDAGLFGRLRELRREIARERGIPPYLVFNDRTLHEMSAYRPQSRRDMSAIHGVGEVKLETYAEPFLAAIREWCGENGEPV